MVKIWYEDKKCEFVKLVATYLLKLFEVRTFIIIVYCR